MAFQRNLVNMSKIWGCNCFQFVSSRLQIVPPLNFWLNHRTDANLGCFAVLSHNSVVGWVMRALRFEFGFTVRFCHSFDDSVSLLIMNNFAVFAQRILILLQFVMQWSQTCFAHSIVVRQGNTILLSRQSDFVVTTYVANWLSGVLSSTTQMPSVSQKFFNMLLISSVSFVSFKKASPDMIRFETTFYSYEELLVGPVKSQPNLLLTAVGPFSLRIASLVTMSH